MNIVISNVVPVAGDAANVPWPDSPANPVMGVLPDMTLPPRLADIGGQNLVQNTPEPSPGVCRAGPRPEVPDLTPPTPDTTLRAPGPRVADMTRPAGSAEHWTVSERLDFGILWRAIELTTAEVAHHFGLSKKHLQRLRADFGLDARPALRQRDRAARRRLVTSEEWAAFMTPGGQALLKIAQARRKVQDAARDVADKEKARRMWEWRRTPPKSEANRLRALFRGGLRAALRYQPLRPSTASGR